MAQIFMGVNVGDNTSQGIVTTGTSDTGKDIQIVVVTGNTAIRKEDVKLYSERILRYLMDVSTSPLAD